MSPTPRPASPLIPQRPLRAANTGATPLLPHQLCQVSACTEGLLAQASPAGAALVPGATYGVPRWAIAPGATGLLDVDGPVELEVACNPATVYPAQPCCVGISAGVACPSPTGWPLLAGPIPSVQQPDGTWRLTQTGTLLLGVLLGAPVGDLGKRLATVAGTSTSPTAAPTVIDLDALAGTERELAFVSDGILALRVAAHSRTDEGGKVHQGAAVTPAIVPPSGSEGLPLVVQPGAGSTPPYAAFAPLHGDALKASSVPNTALVNKGLTINGSFVPLGGSVTVSSGGGLSGLSAVEAGDGIAVSTAAGVATVSVAEGGIAQRHLAPADSADQYGKAIGFDKSTGAVALLSIPEASAQALVAWYADSDGDRSVGELLTDAGAPSGTLVHIDLAASSLAYLPTAAGTVYLVQKTKSTTSRATPWGSAVDLPLYAVVGTKRSTPKITANGGTVLCAYDYAKLSATLGYSETVAGHSVACRLHVGLPASVKCAPHTAQKLRLPLAVGSTRPPRHMIAAGKTDIAGMLRMRFAAAYSTVPEEIPIGAAGLVKGSMHCELWTETTAAGYLQISVRALLDQFDQGVALTNGQLKYRADGTTDWYPATTTAGANSGSAAMGALNAPAATPSPLYATSSKLLSSISTTASTISVVLGGWILDLSVVLTADGEIQLSVFRLRNATLNDPSTGSPPLFAALGTVVAEDLPLAD